MLSGVRTSPQYAGHYSLSAKVVWVQNSIRSCLGDSVHNRCQIGKVLLIIGACHRAWHQSLHEELNPEDVHALADQCADCRRVREDEFFPLDVVSSSILLSDAQHT